LSQTLQGQQEGRRRFIPVAALLLCAVLFGALGAWQVKRLAWKEALIAHVAAVSTAPPVDAATIPFAPKDLADLEYRALRLSGHFEPQGTTLVGALTELGAGFWEMVPLRLNDGRAVWVNRGFLPQGTKREAALAKVPTGPLTLTGLLRRTEPGSTWLRANHPEVERWYNRDIAGITTARGPAQSGTAWFVDARGAEQPGQPVPGLTVLTFPNSHLQYALTWFALCLMSLGGLVLVSRARG